jgi:hypothetical protein
MRESRIHKKKNPTGYILCAHTLYTSGYFQRGEVSAARDKYKGARLLSITQSSCTPKGVIVNKLPGFVRLNSSLEAWRIQIEHHKLPTVKSRLRLE